LRSKRSKNTRQEVYADVNRTRNLGQKQKDVRRRCTEFQQKTLVLKIGIKNNGLRQKQQHIQNTTTITTTTTTTSTTTTITTTATKAKT